MSVKITKKLTATPIVLSDCVTNSKNVYLNNGNHLEVLNYLLAITFITFFKSF